MLIVILGYLSAVLIGISLGLIGGGGSILTVPVLVYFLGVTPVLATAYSLFIVGISSLAGSINCMRKDLVDYKTAMVFGIPSIFAVYFVRAVVVPALPEMLFSIGNIEITRDIGIMLLFSILMIVAAYSMIALKTDSEIQTEGKQSAIPIIITEGLIVGGLTGLVGAGGGFLIIPALVFFGKLPMKKAVGTSLLIIASKSLLGFLGDLGRQEIDWRFLLLFSTFAIIGIFLGNNWSKHFSGPRLKRAFGVFILLMGLFIIFKELYS